MRLGIVLALTALAAASRLLLLAVPNASLVFLVVAIAGLGFGARTGALVGLLAMLITSLMLGGPTPGALLAALAMAFLGASCGALRLTGFPGPRRTWGQTVLAAALGVLLQLAFSVAADAGGWALFAWLPQGASAWPLLLPLLVGGLLFNVPGAVVQAVLFSAALQPVVHALRAAGLAPSPAFHAPAPRPATRTVVVAEVAGQHAVASRSSQAPGS